MTYLLLGNLGKLGAAFEEYFTVNNINYHALNRVHFNAQNPTELIPYLIKHKPKIVINCMALNGKENCRNNPNEASAINSLFPKFLAEQSREFNFTLFHFSTECVFNSKSFNKFNESSIPNPVCQYGTTKYHGEKFIQALAQDFKIIRLPLLFGSNLKSNQLIEKLLSKILHNEEITINQNFYNSPTYIHDIPPYVLNHLIENKTGIYHLRNNGYSSLNDILKKISQALGAQLKSKLNDSFESQQIYLESEKINYLRDFELALADYIVRLKIK